ncbi:MAG: biotin--[acetyl-CoA-carboxylase] ligase [Microbacteriaceae bacterium]|nr:biotin--[acetyl-CoA-carboxylase] ligase [Microbacteriaceae bacterium]
MRLLQTSSLVSTIWREKSASTNTELADLARAGRLAGRTLLATDNQTAGRGRLARTWQQPTGTGLALSFYLPMWQAVAGSLPVSWAALAAGVAMRQACNRLGNGQATTGPVFLKWPNDLLVPGEHARGGLKIGGILCELTGDGGVIIGIGLNLWGMPDDLPEGAASLESCGIIGALPSDQTAADLEKATKIDQILSGFIQNLDTLLKQAKTDPQAAREHITTEIATIGQQTRVIYSDRPEFAGIATGLTANGELLVEGENGETREITSADIEHLRPEKTV